MNGLTFKRNFRVVLLLIMQIIFMTTILSERTQSAPTSPQEATAIISSTWWPSKYEKLTMWVKVWFTYFPDTDIYTYQKWAFEIEFSLNNVIKDTYDDYIRLGVGGVIVYSEMNHIYLDGESIYREVPYQPIPGAITYGTLSVSLFARTYPRPTWGFLHMCEYNLYWLGGWTTSHSQVKV